MITVLLASIAGGLGAALRLTINALVHRTVATRFPLAMTIINVSGSFVLGLFAGLAVGRILSATWTLVLTVGFVGGFTAFSTTSFQTVRLIQERRWWAMVANSFGMLAFSVALAGLGVWIGEIL